MKYYTKAINGFLCQNEPNYGDPDIHSLLEHLWRSYTEYNPIDNQFIRDQFMELEPIFELLPSQY